LAAGFAAVALTGAGFAAAGLAATGFAAAGFAAAGFFTAGLAAVLAAGARAVLGLVAVAVSVPAFTGLFAMVFEIPGAYAGAHRRARADRIDANHRLLNRMSEPAQQIIARGPRAQAERAAAALDEDARFEGLTYSILEEDEARSLWRIDAYPADSEEADALVVALKDFPELATTREVLADADWLEMALSGLPPVRAGRFFIYGLHDRGRAPVNAVALRIEAGAAFGTGHHGTTVGCLLAYAGLLRRKRFDRVLDVGTGTGVLAIAAAKTGARRVVGTDIDRVSVRIARENAKVNAARAAFVYASGLGHAAVRADAPYDLVFANILARPLIGLAQDVRGALAPGGTVILSGLLRSQERAVRAAYQSRGFRVERRIHRDAWATLVMRR
jgi:ribosomal protein L11 methyltransferase